MANEWAFQSTLSSHLAPIVAVLVGRSPVLAVVRPAAVRAQTGVVDLLVLGGTRFVGRVVVAEALRRGWHVTALNRGLTGDLPTAVTPLVADRTDEKQLRTALAGRTFDAVIDTWSGAPIVATTTAAALAGSAQRYAYVSSSSVYAWGTHRNEDSPLG